MMMKSLVEKYQCPGCVCGSDTKCGKYRKSDYDESCDAHVLGTNILGKGRIALGLPKGFDREGPVHGSYRLRIWTGKPDFNKLNVPVWAVRHDGNVIVRTYLPRINRTFVDVIADTNELPAGALDVAEFSGEID